VDHDVKNNNSPHITKIIFWKWWRSVDQQLLIAVSILISISMLLVTTSSSAVALRIGVHEDYFATRHIFYVLGSYILMVGFSYIESDSIKKIAIIGFICNLLLLILVKFYGYDVKGARRWINILGFSLQPSEFIKPCFAVLTGFIFSYFSNRNYSFITTSLVFTIIAGLLISQPDLGMLITLTGIWGIQLFVAGLPIIWIIFSFILLVAGLYFAYKLLPHATARIDNFLHPTLSENYQVTQSLNAFKHGGLFGTGPGEGTVKRSIPDSHSDFIFAVAGEEFGAILCIFISLVFAFIVIRGIILLYKKKDDFLVISASGIIAQLAIQSIINMGVSLNLLPTKGMTLPFISYGGSSTLSIGIAAGILLSFSKTNYTINTKYNIQQDTIVI